MQGFIDSCQCTSEATRLLAAAPLAQLSGPTKLRALLLLLKAYWSFDGRLPIVPGVCLHVGGMDGRVAEQLARNMAALLQQASGAGRGAQANSLTSCGCQPFCMEMKLGNRGGRMHAAVGSVLTLRLPVTCLAGSWPTPRVAAAVFCGQASCIPCSGVPSCNKSQQRSLDFSQRHSRRAAEHGSPRLISS